METELSLLFEIQDLDNGECCLSCRVGRGRAGAGGRLTGWLRFIRYSGSGLQMGRPPGGDGEQERSDVGPDLLCDCVCYSVLDRSEWPKVIGRPACFSSK